MSYREENGQVILTMSREDYEKLLFRLGEATRAYLMPTRQLIDGIWHRVDVSRDGRFRIDFGPDDQRPEADAREVFSPIHATVENGWDRDVYCGKCRRRMRGYLGHQPKEWNYCPRCGAVIGHWDWTHGEVKWNSGKFCDTLPDQLPEFTEDCGFIFASGGKKRLSGDTASGQTSHGKS